MTAFLTMSTFFVLCFVLVDPQRRSWMIPPGRRLTSINIHKIELLGLPPPSFSKPKVLSRDLRVLYVSP
jgi:hypothetical protein